MIVQDEGDETNEVEPRQQIGAQDLLTLNVSHNGFLRHENTLERFVRKTVIFKPFFREAVKWRQRYAVLCDGCMYLYKDELSRAPIKAFALTNFNKIERIECNKKNDRQQRMKFQLVPKDDTTHPLKFCSSTDTERKVWFKKIRNEIEKAMHISSQLRSDFDEEDYVFLETQIQQDNKPSKSRSEPSDKDRTKEQKKEKKKKEKVETKQETKELHRKPLPPIPSEGDDDGTPNDKEDEDDDDDLGEYDYIKEEVVDSFKRPLPETPGTSSAADEKKIPRYQNKGPHLIKPIKPKVAAKPKIERRTRFSRSEFEFNSNDRVQAETILEGEPVGTFLVRKSRSDNQEVLSIKTEDGLKEYKIYNKEKGYSIDNKEAWFKSTEELLEFYAEHSVPNRVLTLTRGYSSSGDEKF